MPIYAYKCGSCGHAKDVLQKISDAPLTVCPSCGADSFSKQVTAAGFQLKGSGWYVTNFRGGNTGAAADKPGDDAVWHADAAQLRAFFYALRAGQREAVRSLALEENSLEDASKSTGRTKTALKVNLHRAIRTLRVRMGVAPAEDHYEKDG